MSVLERLKRAPWWVWLPILVPVTILLTVVLGWFPLIVGIIGWLVARLVRQQSWPLDATDSTELNGQPPEVIKSVVADTSDDELCELWMRSTQELRQAYLPATISSNARLRQALLEEMERRHPEAVDRWLADRPDQLDPRRYLEHR